MARESISDVVILRCKLYYRFCLMSLSFKPIESFCVNFVNAVLHANLKM